MLSSGPPCSSSHQWLPSTLYSCHSRTQIFPGRSFLKYLFIYCLPVIVCCVWAWRVCHGAYVMVRGQLLEIRSPLPLWVLGIRLTASDLLNKLLLSIEPHGQPWQISFYFLFIFVVSLIKLLMVLTKQGASITSVICGISHILFFFWFGFARMFW